MDKTTLRITTADYDQLPETSQPTELIDGEIVMAPAPNIYHQKIAFNIIRFFVKSLEGEGEVYFSPIDVRLDEHNIVQPDVMWVSGPDSLCQRDSDGTRWYGGPDLVCEILSPSTAKHDKGEKFALYEKHGVKEYWLLDPVNQWIEVYTRQEEKLILLEVYHKVIFTSPLLQREIDTNIIFAGWFE
jgi:Uma2 family endonuclease